MARMEAAAVEGHAEAQVELARMLANGMGVPQSFINAYVWYDMAVRNGSAPAVYGRRNAEKKMTAAEIGDAKRLAGICFESKYRDCD